MLRGSRRKQLLLSLNCSGICPGGLLVLLKGEGIRGELLPKRRGGRGLPRFTAGAAAKVTTSASAVGAAATKAEAAAIAAAAAAAAAAMATTGICLCYR